VLVCRSNGGSLRTALHASADKTSAVAYIDVQQLLALQLQAGHKVRGGGGGNCFWLKSGKQVLEYIKKHGNACAHSHNHGFRERKKLACAHRRTHTPHTHTHTFTQNTYR
jgi:hypothetical protein